MCNRAAEIRHKVNLPSSVPTPNTAFTDFHFSELLESLKVCRNVIKIHIQETIANSWATRSTYQEDSRSCILCCHDSKDNLKHYLQCESIWTLATIAIPSVGVSGTLEDRLRLHSTPVVRIRILAVAYRAHHALVFEFQHLIENAVLDDDYEPVFMCFMQLVKVAWLHPWWDEIMRQSVARQKTCVCVLFMYLIFVFVNVLRLIRYWCAAGTREQHTHVYPMETYVICYCA